MAQKVIHGATQEVGIIDPATGKTCLGGPRDGAVVFVFVEGDDHAPVANLLEEQQRLAGRDELLDG